MILQVTLSMESILRYYHQYGDSTSPSMDSHFCLRLNDLSLSRIGNVEQLLWIQMLDLSHNKIRSIEGNCIIHTYIASFKYWGIDLSLSDFVDWQNCVVTSWDVNLYIDIWGYSPNKGKGEERL